MLADFGISLPKIEDRPHTRLTEVGVSLGTPSYMSPEQVTGQEVDRRSDIYALGAVAYEMLAGQPPFTGSTVQTVLTKVISEEPRPVVEHRKSVPSHVSGAILKALEKLPADRWQTASEFADALAGHGAHEVARTGRSSRAVIPWALAAVLALALGWIGFRDERAIVPPNGPVRFGVEFDRAWSRATHRSSVSARTAGSSLCPRWSSGARKCCAACSIA